MQKSGWSIVHMKLNSALHLVREEIPPQAKGLDVGGGAVCMFGLTDVTTLLLAFKIISPISQPNA